MFPYKVIYFDRFQRYIGERYIAVPGRDVLAIQKLILSEYWDAQSIGHIEPAYACAVAQDAGAESVLVVKSNG